MADISAWRSRAYLLSRVLKPVEVRCKYLLCDSFQALLIGFLDARDWSQSFDKTAVLMLNAICGVLTYLVYERDGLHWCPCLEEDHYVD